MGKIKNIFKPDLPAIIQNIYASILFGILLSIWSKSTNILSKFYSWVAQMNINEIVKSVINMVIPVLGFAVIIWVALLFIGWAIRKIRRKIQKESIVGINNGIKLYKDDSDKYSSEHARAGAGLSDHIRLWIIASNGKRPLYECRIVLDNLEFLGNNTCGNWITAPGGFERKAMKWDDGSPSGKGETDFAQYEKKILEIARVNKSKRIMELPHLDGYSKRTQNQSGKYRFTLKVYANNKFVIKFPIKPITYIVNIKYEQGSSIIRIEDIKRDEL